MVKKLLHLGLSHTKGRKQAKQIYLTNGIALITGSTAIPFLAYYAFQDRWWPLFTVNVIFLLSYGLVLLLNHCRLFSLSRWYLVVSSNVLILLGCYQFGREMNLQLSYFILVILPLIIFELRERKSIIACMSLSALFYLVVETWPQFAGQIPLQQLLLGRAGEALLILILLAFIVYSFRLTNEHHEKELELLLNQISSQQEIIVNASKLSALGEMAGGIAHEINNPLMAIQLRIFHVKSLANKNLLTTEKLISSLNNIEEIIKRITKIIQGLRSFAREGHHDPFITESVAKVLEDTLSLCQERFKYSGTRLEVSPFSPDLHINCRPIQVTQILLNLLNNAFDAIQGLSDKWVKVNVVELEAQVAIEVIDSGPGIPPDLREKLFRPFFTTKSIGQGTGLGLSISKGLATSEKGDLHFDFSSPHTKCVLTLLKATSP